MRAASSAVAVRQIAAARASSSRAVPVLKPVYQTTRLASTSTAPGDNATSTSQMATPPTKRLVVVKHGQKMSPIGSKYSKAKADPLPAADKQSESQQKLTGFSKSSGKRLDGQTYWSADRKSKLGSTSPENDRQLAKTQSKQKTDSTSRKDRKPPRKEAQALKKSEALSQRALSIADGQTESSSMVDDMTEAHADLHAETTEADPQADDQISSVQERLRAFFAAKNGGRINDSINASLTGGAQDPSASQNAETRGLKLESVVLDDAVTQDSESSTEAKASLSFSRPKLSDLQRSGPDAFIGHYQSETVWDPNEEYALMPDGPPTEPIAGVMLDKAPDQHIMVILDGDNLLFDPRHMNLGYEGGKFCFNELRERIAKKHRLDSKKLDLRIRIFCAVIPLSSVLEFARIVTKATFFDFVQGLVDSGPYNYLVNVGKASQAADLRVKAALADAIRDPRCFRAYLGGLDDYGYKEDLAMIHKRGLLETKVNLIQVPGYAVESNAYRKYAHRAIDLDYLFKSQAEAAKDAPRVEPAEKRHLTQSLSSPCVFFHLSKFGCSKPICNFSHDPIPEERKESIRKALKSRKCPIVARGEQCPHGDDCLWS